jgi:hypothetical protein
MQFAVVHCEVLCVGVLCCVLCCGVLCCGVLCSIVLLAMQSYTCRGAHIFALLQRRADGTCFPAHMHTHNHFRPLHDYGIASFAAFGRMCTDQAGSCRYQWNISCPEQLRAKLELISTVWELLVG